MEFLHRYQSKHKTMAKLESACQLIAVYKNGLISFHSVRSHFQTEL